MSGSWPIPERRHSDMLRHMGAGSCNRWRSVDEEVAGVNLVDQVAGLARTAQGTGEVSRRVSFHNSMVCTTQNARNSSSSVASIQSRPWRHPDTSR